MQTKASKMYRTEKELLSVCIQQNESIKAAIKRIDTAHFGIGIIVNESNEVLGILTDPDIRRLILQSIDLNEAVTKLMNKVPVLVQHKIITKVKLTKIFAERGFSQIPIVDNDNKLVDLVFKSDLFKIEIDKQFQKIDTTVIIMAGGKGERMEPFTSILPKPLIPIGNQSMLEVIMDEYAKYGIRDFCISVNYKANLIKAYLTDANLNYNISYIQEDQPLGTAGSLKLLEKQKLDKPFFVSNCDIIIKDDYSKIYDFHVDSNYDITLVGSLQHHKIPYGVCEIENGGELVKINEKPEYDFLVNTGMYIINPEVLQYIPDNEFFHITHLIEKIKGLGKKVGVFPVSEKSWIDIGRWGEYRKAVDALKF